MKTIKIPLSQGQFATIDEKDLSLVSKHKWYAVKHATDKTFYAVTNIKDNNDKYFIFGMHKLIMGVSRKQQIDHIDRNALNNKRNNLRLCTGQQNCFNRAKKKDGLTSKYKGVSWHKLSGKWIVHINIDKNFKHLGLFISETEAALMYNKMAKKHYGEFANLNIIE